MNTYVNVYRIIYLRFFLLIFYKINATNGHLHNHYFLSVPYLMKSSCWRKKTHRRVCEVIPGSKQFPPKAKLYSTYLVLLIFLTPTIFLKVSHPTSNAFDLYWKKSKGEGDSKSILPRAPIVERNCQSIEVRETRKQHLPRKGGGYFSDNPIACSNE